MPANESLNQPSNWKLTNPKYTNDDHEATMESLKSGAHIICQYNNVKEMTTYIELQNTDQKKLKIIEFFLNNKHCKKIPDISNLKAIKTGIETAAATKAEIAAATVATAATKPTSAKKHWKIMKTQDVLVRQAVSGFNDALNKVNQQRIQETLNSSIAAAKLKIIEATLSSNMSARQGQINYDTYMATNTPQLFGAIIPVSSVPIMNGGAGPEANTSFDIGDINSLTNNKQIRNKLHKLDWNIRYYYKNTETQNQITAIHDLNLLSFIKLGKLHICAGNIDTDNLFDSDPHDPHKTDLNLRFYSLRPKYIIKIIYTSSMLENMTGEEEIIKNLLMVNNKQLLIWLGSGNTKIKCENAEIKELNKLLISFDDPINMVDNPDTLNSMRDMGNGNLLKLNIYGHKEPTLENDRIVSKLSIESTDTEEINIFKDMSSHKPFIEPEMPDGFGFVDYNVLSEPSAPTEFSAPTKSSATNEPSMIGPTGESKKHVIATQNFIQPRDRDDITWLTFTTNQKMEDIKNCRFDYKTNEEICDGKIYQWADNDYDNGSFPLSFTNYKDIYVDQADVFGFGGGSMHGGGKDTISNTSIVFKQEGEDGDYHLYITGHDIDNLLTEIISEVITINNAATAKLAADRAKFNKATRENIVHSAARIDEMHAHNMQLLAAERQIFTNAREATIQQHNTDTIHIMNTTLAKKRAIELEYQLKLLEHKNDCDIKQSKHFDKIEETANNDTRIKLEEYNKQYKELIGILQQYKETEHLLIQNLEITLKIKEEQEKTKEISSKYLLKLIADFGTLQEAEKAKLATQTVVLEAHNKTITAKVAASQEELDRMISQYTDIKKGLTTNIGVMEQLTASTNESFTQTFGSIDRLKENIDKFTTSAVNGVETHKKNIAGLKSRISTELTGLLDREFDHKDTFTSLRTEMIANLPNLKAADISLAAVDNLFPVGGKPGKGGARKQPNSKKHIRKSSKKTKKKKSKKPKKPAKKK